MYVCMLTHGIIHYITIEDVGHSAFVCLMYAPGTKHACFLLHGNNDLIIFSLHRYFVVSCNLANNDLA